MAAALGRGGVRERQARVRVQADPPGAEGHGRQGIGQTGHAADGQAWPGAPVQEREAVQLVQGRARQGAEEPGEPRLPRRASEHAVGHGPHGVLDSRGQGLSVARDRLLRRASGRVDDRHQPERGIGQRHAHRRVLHARGRGETNHPFRPRRWPTACSPARAPRSGTGRSRSSIPTAAATTGGPSGSASARTTT